MRVAVFSTKEYDRKYLRAANADGRHELTFLLTFPNVLITSHQGFFTHEALSAIAAIIVCSLTAFERNEDLAEVRCAP